MSRRPPSPGLKPYVLALGCLIAAALLSACTTIGSPGVRSSSGSAAMTMGSGNSRVALLLPLSAPGHGGETARAFRHAVELAMADYPSADIQVTVHDTLGTPAGAQAAASASLAGGAEIFLGPLFSSEVAAVAPLAREAGVPVVAFSSDANMASPGVYLLSFLPADDVKRIVSYSAGQGRKSFAALLPSNAYGAVVEAAFRSDVAAAGGRIVAIKGYQPTRDDMRAKAAEIAALASQVDALLLPDTGQAVPVIAAALAERGVTRDRVQLLGSGQWDDPRILNSPAMVGGWFPAPVKQGFEDFSRKYFAAYGAPPPRNASLAYDATVLVAGLVRQYGTKGFQSEALTSPSGFAGIDGLFRFLPGGLTERRLSVYEVTGSGASVVAPAAARFTTED